MAEQATDNRGPVSRRALIQRINRKLPGHETLKTNRAPGSTQRELGRYFTSMSTTTPSLAGSSILKNWDASSGSCTSTSAWQTDYRPLPAR